jgi:hypothetical protein
MVMAKSEVTSFAASWDRVVVCRLCAQLSSKMGAGEMKYGLTAGKREG